nr:MAG TPA: hypothetical protein [Caudoviricetes sp.]
MRCGLEACRISRMILSKSYILLIFSISYKIFHPSFLEIYIAPPPFLCISIYVYIHYIFLFFKKSTK